MVHACVAMLSQQVGRVIDLVITRRGISAWWFTLHRVDDTTYKPYGLS